MSRHALREWITAKPDANGVYCVTTLPAPPPPKDDAFAQAVRQMRVQWRFAEEMRARPVIFSGPIV